MKIDTLKNIVLCSNSSSILKHEEWAYLWCIYNSFTIRIEFVDDSFKYEDDVEYDYDEYESTDIHLNNLLEFDVNNIEIRNSTDLDCLSDADNQEAYRYIYHKIQSALSCDNAVKILYSEYGIIADEDLAWNNCSMCTDYTKHYGYSISINVEKNNLNKIFSILLDINKELYTTEKRFGILDFKGNKHFDLYSSVPIIPSNTKTRRLGYLKLIMYMLNTYKRISSTMLSRRFEFFCSDYKSKLSELEQNKGNVIITKNGSSAQPYIDISLKLGLISVQNNIVEIGKIGKVYLSLKQEIDCNEDNPFLLSLFDKTFLLEIVLKADYLFSSTIVERFLSNSILDIDTLKNDFHDILLDKFNALNELFGYTNQSTSSEIKDVSRRIKEWKKPDIYLKHVLYPRINRLFEFGFIDMIDSSTYRITEKGLRLSYYIAVIEGTYIQPTQVDDILKMSYISLADNLYEIRGSKFEISNNSNLLERYIEESFVLFRTIAPNRTTFSMLNNYVRYRLLFSDKIIFETEDCINFLEQNDKYILKIQQQYKDGYVQRR